MTLDNLPKKTPIVFSQRDVRETPAATATATSVGLTDLDYVLLSTDADVTNERVLTMGEGLDMTDNGPGNTVVISGEHATDTGNKGIATYDASDFDVAAGVVTIDDSGVDHDQTTNFLVAEHRNWESSIAQNIHADNYTDTGDTTYTAGEGLDLDGTVFSGENASDSGNKGIASFNPSDFDVTDGAVSIDDSGIDHNAIGNTHNMTTDIDARMSAGEGINYVEGTISAETASETNRGIATFDGTDFTVSTGDVTLKATVLMSMDGDSGTAIPAVHNIDILGGEGINTIGAGNDITISGEDSDVGNKGIVIVAGGEGIDVSYASGTATVSGENATTSNKGIVELATIDETQTGTDEAKVITPNSLFEVLPPIGAIIAWNKSLTGVPQTLPVGYRECDGSTISDAESPMNGQNLPDLNGDNRFLRGNSTSEGTGGSETHTHGLAFENNGENTGDNTTTRDANSNSASTLPTYFEVVWIMRIK